MSRIETPTIVAKKVFSKNELYACLAIRKKVFVEGQKVPLYEDLDGKDAASDHYLLALNNVPIGVARVRLLGTIAKIERVAILAEHQGQGLGKTIMHEILSDLNDNPAVLTAKLSAQTYAIPFYEKFGFIVCSEEYMDAGIPHKDMQLFLDRNGK